MRVCQLIPRPLTRRQHQSSSSGDTRSPPESELERRRFGSDPEPLTMVFESLVSDLLNRFIGDYVENLDKSQLKIGIWGGEFVS